MHFFNDFLFIQKGVPDAQLPAFLDSKPVVKVEKSGNTYIYTSTSSSGTREVKFTSGVEIDDLLEGNVPVSLVHPSAMCTFINDFKRSGN